MNILQSKSDVTDSTFWLVRAQGSLAPVSSRENAAQAVLNILLCRAATRVKTQQAWHAAVRHTGLLFQLPAPAPTTATAAATALSAAQASDDSEALQEAADAALPYPQLAQTVNSTNFAPLAHLSEHYSPPGGTDTLQLRIRAAQKMTALYIVQAIGWFDTIVFAASCAPCIQAAHTSYVCVIMAASHSLACELM